MRKLLPMILALIGLCTGVGAGFFLRPAHDPAAEEASTEPEVSEDEQPDYVKLNNQFIVPVVENGKVSAMVILSLSLEVAKGSTDAIYAKEPKFRDVFLQVLFDHANAGGFRGSFTDGANLIVLRKSLLEAAQSALPDVISDVLIADIARQDS